MGQNGSTAASGAKRDSADINSANPLVTILPPIAGNANSRGGLPPRSSQVGRGVPPSSNAAPARGHDSDYGPSAHNSSNALNSSLMQIHSQGGSQLASFSATEVGGKSGGNVREGEAVAASAAPAGPPTAAGGFGPHPPSASNLGDFWSIDDCSVNVAIRHASSMNRLSMSRNDTGGNAQGQGGAAGKGGGRDSGDGQHTPVSIEEARSLFEVIFSPPNGQLECIVSQFISVSTYSAFAQFFNPFLENDPLRKKWFVDNTMRVVIGRDRWRSTREPEIVATPNKDQVKQLIQLRKDYTDLLREKLLEMADVMEGPVGKRKKSSFREQVAMFNASKEAARQAGTYAAGNNANTSPTGKGGRDASPDRPDPWLRPLGNAGAGTASPNPPPSSTGTFSTSQTLQGTEYDVIMARLLHASSTSFDCFHLLASRIPTKLLADVPVRYLLPETPVVWSTVGCPKTLLGGVSQSFFVPLSHRVELLQKWLEQREREKLVGIAARAENFASPASSPSRASPAVAATNSSHSAEPAAAVIDSPASLFSAVRNLSLVLTTAFSSMVLQVMIDLADAIKMRQRFRDLKAQAKAQNKKLEHLVGPGSLPKKHFTGDPGNSLSGWKEFVMIEEMTLPVLAQLLVRRFYEKAANKDRMTRLRMDFVNIFAYLTHSSKEEQDLVPTRTIGSLVLKLMFLLAGGQRSIEADDRRVPCGSRQSTDDLSLAHMLDVPVLDYICWTACLLGMPVMSPKGSLLQKRRERPLTFIEADEVAGVMRVLFQEVGALPSGKSCPHNYRDWLPMFPLYAVNTEGKRTLMYLYSVQVATAKPLPLVIQKDMALQSFAAIVTERMKGFAAAQSYLNIKSMEELKETEEAERRKLSRIIKEHGDQPVFEADKITSYLFQPTMTAGYAQMQKDVNPAEDDTALGDPATDIANLPDAPILPTNLDPRNPMNFQFTKVNPLLGSTDLEQGSGDKSDQKSSSGSLPSLPTKSQPLTASALTAMKAQYGHTDKGIHPLVKGTPGVTEDDDIGSNSSDSSCSTLLDPNMNIDAYTCVSPAAQLYLRCANEAIVKRHKITELTPFVAAELYRSMSVLEGNSPDLYKEVQSYLRELPPQNKKSMNRLHAKDSILVLRWTSAEPMVTFQAGDIISIVMERPAMSNASSRYFNNMSRRTSHGNSVHASPPGGPSEEFGTASVNFNGGGNMSPRSPSLGASHGPRATRRQSVTIDVGPDHEASYRSALASSSKKAAGSNGYYSSAHGGGLSEHAPRNYWAAANVSPDDSLSVHTDRSADGLSSTTTTIEDKLKHAMTVQLTVRVVSDPVRMRQYKRPKDVVMLVKASTAELPDISRALSVGHERASMSPFFYLEGDTTMCWTNTRLIASIVAAFRSANEAQDGGHDGGHDGDSPGHPLASGQPCGYTAEQLKRMFYAIGVLLANAITNAVFFSIPMAPLCFWLVKKSLESADPSFASFAWLEPCDGNLLSPPMVLNAAYDIMNLSDKAYLDFLRVRGFSSPDNLLFPLFKRGNGPGLTVPRPPSNANSGSYKRNMESSQGSKLSASRTSARDTDAPSSTSGHRPSVDSIGEAARETVMRSYIKAIKDHNSRGCLNNSSSSAWDSPRRPSALSSGPASPLTRDFNGSSSHLSLSSQTSHMEPAQVRQALESLPSREDYIALYLVNEIVWGSACKNGFGRDVKDLWVWMAKGFLSSPIARSPLMTHCCSRVIREVLCMPVNGKKSSSEF